MELLTVAALRGPNIWWKGSALQATVSVAGGDPAVSGPALEARLRAALPALGPLPARALERSTGAAAYLLEAVGLALQRQAGCAVSFGRSAPLTTPDHFVVVVEYGEEAVGRAALDTARELVMSALAGAAFDVTGAVARLRSLDEMTRLGPSTGAIVRAARTRGIPTRRLTDGSLVQFGWGARQRRILAAETDQTSAIAETIAQDKDLTKLLLSAVGVPTPIGRQVSSAADAWAAALELGVPVVVKPRYGSQGRGVAVDLQTEEQVVAAYQASQAEDSQIIVERHAAGMDHRLLVIGDQLLAAARREPPLVVGDGRRSVRALVEEVNRDPRRGEDHATALSKIPLDAIALGVLAEQGLTADSVPDAAQRVLLRRNANLSTGGTAADVTDEVHPSVAARAVDAARAVGLDICGVDIVCQDIRRPLEEQGGVMLEVNAAPGLRMHLSPSEGKPRPVGEAVVSMMFAPGDDGRIPIVAVTGNNGKSTTARLIAGLLTGHGRRVGLTCTDGIYVEGQRIEAGDCAGPKSARAILAHPDVDAAVLETARGGILREGLGFDRCDVAVVTNMGEGDHLGLRGVETVEQLTAVKRVLVENVAPSGTAVLNAADPLVMAMARFCPGAVTLFAVERGTPALAAHLDRGGRGTFVEAGVVIAAEGAVEQRVAALEMVPLTQGGAIRFQVENVLAAVAAAFSLGLPVDTIREVLGRFVSDFATVPGRFNVIAHAGATIIVDYGHNVDAMEALVLTLPSFPHDRRKVVMTAAGDRRDDDLVRLARIVGSHFDEVILFEDACNRGRADGEVIALLRRGLAQAGRVSKITELRGEWEAISLGFAELRPRDLYVVLADDMSASLPLLQRHLAGDPTS